MGCGQSTEAVPKKNIYETKAAVEFRASRAGGYEGHVNTFQMQQQQQQEHQQRQQSFRNNPSGGRGGYSKPSLGKSVVGEVAALKLSTDTHNNADTSTKRDKAAHHLRNVFVPRIDEEDLSNFKPPKFPHSEEEMEFLRNTLMKNFLFLHLADTELEIIVGAFEKVTFNPGENIITQGDTGDYFFIVYSGACTFNVDGSDVGTCGSGDGFGELSLLYSSPRAASVIADDPTVAFRVDQNTFRFVMQSQNQHADTEKIEVLKKISFLKGLENFQLQKLSTAMTLQSFRNGDYIVRKGEIGEAFFILHVGEVKVTDISVGSTVYEDFTMGPGEYFGERAIIKSEPRAANVVATTDGVVFSIDRSTFEKVLGDVANLILRSQDKRRLGGIRCIKNTHLPSSTLDVLAGLIQDKNFRAGTVVMTEGEDTEPALYIIRSGKCKVDSKDGAINDSVTEGQLIGENHLVMDVGKKRGSQFDNATLADLKNTDSSILFADDEDNRKYVAAYSVEAVEDTLCGVLYLKDMRSVIDTTKIGEGPAVMKKSKIEQAMVLDDLKRHTILGQGTFGQVWLVSLPDEKGVEIPYALKIQSKHELVVSQQAKGVVKEMEIMSQLNHPFLARLIKTFQNRDLIYMLLGYVQGGELYSRMHTEIMDGLPEFEARFYAAGITEGICFMHRRQIIYRDLKPENVMIDSNGYPIIIDFGFAKHVPQQTYTFCGTPLYIAPEVVLNKGHSVGADHWSLGCIIYEMITGDTPFFEEYMDQLALYRAICSGHFRIKPLIEHKRDALDLVNKLLAVEPAERLGVLAGGQMEIFNHQWFYEIDFDQLRNKAIPAPWVPRTKNILDTSNFEDWGHLEDKSKEKFPEISQADQDLFAMFGQF